MMENDLPDIIVENVDDVQNVQSESIVLTSMEHESFQIEDNSQLPLDENVNPEKNIFDQICDNYSYLGEAMKIEYQFHKTLMQYDDFGKVMANVDDCLLNLAVCGSVQALFYARVERFILDGTVIHCLRYLEYGDFEKASLLIKEKVARHFDIDVLLPCSIFNKIDFEEKKRRQMRKYATRRKDSSKEGCSKSAYQRQLSTNKKSLKDSFEKLVSCSTSHDDIQLLFSIVSVLHKSRKFKDENNLKGSGKVFLCSEEANSEWDKTLMQHRLSCSIADNAPSLHVQFTETPSLHEQYAYLSAIPNFHRWQWKKEGEQFQFSQRYSACNRYPGSPRNRVIQALHSRPNSRLITYPISKCILGEHCEIPYHSIRDSLKRKKGPSRKINSKKRDIKAMANNPDPASEHEETVDVGEEVPSTDNVPQPINSTVDITEEDPEIDNGLHEINSVTDIADEVQTTDDDDNVQNVNERNHEVHQSSYQESLYMYYCGELMNCGMLIWRLDEVHNKVIMMNDTDKNGNFLQYNYVHVSASLSSGAFYDISCTCQLYGTSSKSDNPAVQSTFACIHCRLFSDILCDRIGILLRGEFLQHAIEALSDRVTKVSSKHDVQKFSIVGPNSVRFVSISTIENTPKKIAQCHGSVCNMGKKQRRDILYLDSPELCEHLQTLYQHMVSNPTQFLFDEDDYEQTPFLPRVKWENAFDETTGIYIFGKQAPSTQKIPNDAFSEPLREALIARDKYTLMEENICFQPNLPEETCQCLAGWSSLEQPVGIVKFQLKTKLYTDRHVHVVNIFERQCISGKCKKKWTGEQQSIYRSSSRICAGYEIGWLYVDAVNNSKQTFNGFVNVMNSSYQRRNADAYFMSLPSFINWWFGWASHMCIDFRMKCPSCEQIDILACDGTKLGMGFAHVFVDPIEAPVADLSVTKTKMRRHDRSYIVTANKSNASVYQAARNHLRYICLKILGKTSDNLETEEYIRRTNSLREILPEHSREAFIRMESSVNVATQLRIALANHFLQLSYDCSVDTFVPLEEAGNLLQFVKSCEENILSVNECLSFSNRQQSFNKEIAEVISACVLSGNNTPQAFIFKHIAYLANFVKLVHEQDVPPMAPSIKPHSYNPCKYGRAFYFHPHGSQLREIRRYSIDTERSTNVNYDDDPHDNCRKIFPQVSPKGTTFLFLWFCPNHGHCYGFHVIPGSEGRKDPAAALYSHLEKAPKYIFYDHACSLSESGFFKNTRFFHDVFHGYTHKCSISFRSLQTNLFSQTNTSICEQFNAYIQRIKSSAKHLGQAHFTFYLQFFIHQWNMQQQSRIEKLKYCKELVNAPHDDEL